MKGNKFFTIFFTFIFTTLFWGLVLLICDRTNDDNLEEDTLVLADAIEPVEPMTDAATEESSTNATLTTIGTADLDKAIVGKWKPIETAKYVLEFSQYGTMKRSGTGYTYQIKNGKLRYTSLSHYYDDFFRIVITTDGTNTYLEIYDDIELGGRYIKVK